MNIETRLRRVAILCAHFIRNFAYYRAGYDGKELKLNSEFWITVNGNFYDICILEWSKLFADENDGHCWVRVVEDRERFQVELLEYLGLEEKEFSDYINSIRKYRDKFVAHLDSENRITLPHLGLAEKYVEFYYSHLITLNEDRNFLGRLPRDIAQYREICNGQALEVYG